MPTHVKKRYFTAEDIQFLRENAAKLTYAQLGKALGRSADNIHQKMRRLGIKKTPIIFRSWFNKDDKRLIELSERFTLVQIAKKLGRTYPATCARFRLLKQSTPNLRLGSAIYSLDKAHEATGYARSQLMRAKEKLGQKWTKIVKGKKRGKYAITDEQLEELCEYLAKETAEFKSSKNFWKDVIKTDTCWFWNSRKRSVRRRAKINGIEKVTNVRRIVWALVNNKWPPSQLYLIAMCKKGNCINPNHMLISAYRDSRIDSNTGHRIK